MPCWVTPRLSARRGSDTGTTSVESWRNPTGSRVNAGTCWETFLAWAGSWNRTRLRSFGGAVGICVGSKGHHSGRQQAKPTQERRHHGGNGGLSCGSRSKLCGCFWREVAGAEPASQLSRVLVLGYPSKWWAASTVQFTTGLVKIRQTTRTPKRSFRRQWQLVLAPPPAPGLLWATTACFRLDTGGRLLRYADLHGTDRGRFSWSGYPHLKENMPLLNCHLPM